MYIIKRYPNRKLYDTTQKKYITLSEIANLIQNGHDIQVIDNNSQEDITAITLSQIIHEQEKKHSGFLPGSILTSLVRSGEDKLSSLQRTLLSQINLTRFIDEELLRRIESLIASGDLEAEEGRRLGDKLTGFGVEFQEKNAVLSREIQINEEQIQYFIRKQGYPTRDDIQRISEQLDELSEKIEHIMKDTA